MTRGISTDVWKCPASHVTAGYQKGAAFNLGYATSPALILTCAFI